MVYKYKGEALTRISKMLKRFIKISHFSLPTLVSLNLSYNKIIEFIENLDLILGDLTYSIKDALRNQIYANI